MELETKTPHSIVRQVLIAPGTYFGDDDGEAIMSSEQTAEFNESVNAANDRAEEAKSEYVAQVKKLEDAITKARTSYADAKVGSVAQRDAMLAWCDAKDALEEYKATGKMPTVETKK